MLYSLHCHLGHLKCHKDQWTPSIGEELQTTRELTNAYDSFAVAVTKEGDTVGHVPREISRTCLLVFFGEEQHNCMQSY